jgi:hypothetical protein
LIECADLPASRASGVAGRSLSAHEHGGESDHQPGRFIRVAEITTHYLLSSFGQNVCNPTKCPGQDLALFLTSNPKFHERNCAVAEEFVAIPNHREVTPGIESQLDIEPFRATLGSLGVIGFVARIG